MMPSCSEQRLQSSEFSCSSSVTRALAVFNCSCISSVGEVAGAGGIGTSENVEAVAGLAVDGATPAFFGGGALDGVLGTEVRAEP